jgi:hypothetical protein
MVFLGDVFRQDGYNDRQIHKVLNRLPNISKPDNKPNSVAFLSHVGPIFNRVSRLLGRRIIKSFGLSHKKVSSFLRPVRDNLRLRTPGVYTLPCECGRVCFGQTGRSVDTRLKEHQRHIPLEHPHKLAVADHRDDLGHRVQFHNTSILPLKPDAWIALLGRLFRLSSIPTIRTERLVFLSPIHRSLSLAPSRNLQNMTPDLLGCADHTQ